MPATATSLTVTVPLSIAGASVGVATWPVLFQAVGIPPSVLTMAAVGAITGLLFQRPRGSRWRVFGLAYAYTVVSAAAVVVIQKLSMFAWVGDVAAAAALLLAFFSQHLLPITRDALTSRVKKLIGGTP